MKVKNVLNKTLNKIYEWAFVKNPVTVFCLGLCPAIAVTTTAMNGITMGLITMIALVFSNFVMSFFKKVLSGGWWLICFLIVSSSITAIIDLLIRAVYPGIHEMLGVFIPLTAINTLIFERTIKFSSKTKRLHSFLESVGMGLVYTIMLAIIGIFREIIGLGSIFGHQILPDSITIPIIAMAPGGFFVLACLIALTKRIGGRR